MSKEFFNLPESTKRMIWEALLARWETKNPPPDKRMTGCKMRFPDHIL